MQSPPTRISMRPWAGTSAAAGPTQEFVRRFTERRSWRMQGGRNERAGNGGTAGVHKDWHGDGRRIVGEPVCSIASRIKQRACRGRKRFCAECVCANRNRRKRDGDFGAFGDGAGSLYLFADAFERGAASGLVENSRRGSASGQSL